MKNKTGLASATAAVLMFAGQAGAATTVPVLGEFTDYRFIGVSFNADPQDPTTWPVGPITFSLSGTVTVDGGVVTAATLNAGTVTQLFTQTGGLNPTEGTFEGLVYTLSGTNLVQAPGTGAGVTGSCTLLSGTAFDACDNALLAWQTEADSRLTNWNGIAPGSTVSDTFGGGFNEFFAPLITGDGVTWNVAGLEVGDSITADLLRFELGIVSGNPNPLFNSAFAGTLNLTVVPVPAAVWLFASALGLVGFLRRRAVS
ncbi:MAG: hypothetical protein JJT85_10075 [Chromatiales bacterium]|nr:hypothetical protein [Chromatiales bacterium]